MSVNPPSIHPPTHKRTQIREGVDQSHDGLGHLCGKANGWMDGVMGGCSCARRRACEHPSVSTPRWSANTSSGVPARDLGCRYVCV